MKIDKLRRKKIFWLKYFLILIGLWILIFILPIIFEKFNIFDFILVLIISFSALIGAILTLIFFVKTLNSEYEENEIHKRNRQKEILKEKNQSLKQKVLEEKGENNNDRKN